MHYFLTDIYGKTEVFKYFNIFQSQFIASETTETKKKKKQLQTLPKITPAESEHVNERTKCCLSPPDTSRHWFATVCRFIRRVAIQIFTKPLVIRIKTHRPAKMDLKYR